MTLASERFFEKYNKLPKDVQRAMFSSLTSDRIFEIGSKHGLAIDKMGLLSQEIGVVLLGEKRASQFVESLQKALGLNHEKAYEIAQDVNHSIFYEIRENLKKIHGVPVTEALIPEKPLGVQTPVVKAAAAAPQTRPQIPKPQTTSTVAVSQAPKLPAAPGPTAPTLQVAVAPSAPAASLGQPRPIAAEQPAANARAAGAPTYWRVLDTAKKDAAPMQPAAPIPPNAPSTKAEVSLSNGVNHEIEENRKGSLARIEQKEEERALGVQITSAPRPSRLASQNLLENEVGTILGGSTPMKPREAVPPNLPIAPPATRPAPQAAVAEPAGPAEKTSPVSVPTPPQKTEWAKPPPPLPKIQVPQSPAPKSVGGDPYREPIEG
ncbi:MAG: hypothetical protein UY71_C0037G0004 [Parcubacteria group bacterium GW2011_GWB1_52_7]|nr:MAG: hypothetical protein UY71_C0037G0004 [Parcubacteria group bacterium GW2011_GWB1_52_7]